MKFYRKPSLSFSLIPVFFLIGMIVVCVQHFGSGALEGPNQIALLLAAAVCSAIAIVKYKRPWEELEKGVISNISHATPAIIILFFIGALSGAWMVSGVVPSMIYYGLKLIHPAIFLMAACILCAIVSVASGSSWTTVATVGVAMLGIGRVLGYEDAWIAGAIISGAYFGDKVSPLSDTTNLAAAISGTDLFTHVRYMFYTTVPSMALTLIIFGVKGFMHEASGEIQLDEFYNSLNSTFFISPLLFIVPIATFVLISKGMPAIIIMMLASLMGVFAAVLFQPEVCKQIAGEGLTGIMAYFHAGMTTLFGSTSLETGNETLNNLVSTNGMGGMLNTVWLIVCAMIFGGIMEASGMLRTITETLVKQIRSRFSAVLSTTLSCLFLNVGTSDQYLSIIVPAKMFSNAFRKKGLQPQLLSRTIEDSATVTSVLIPWNTCGMAQSTVLGVATLTYLPFCFFNIISPFMTLLVAAIGYKIVEVDPVEEEAHHQITEQE